MEELQINVFQLFLFPVWFRSLVLVGNKVFVVLEACFLLLDILHSSCLSLRHGGSNEDLGRGTRQKKMPLWRSSGDWKSCTDRLWVHIRIFDRGVLRH